MKLLEQAVRDGVFLLDLDAGDMPSIFRETVAHLVARGLLPDDARNDVVRALLAREAEVSTAIGHSVAVPHAYLDVLSVPCVVFVQLSRPVNLGAPDGIPTRFLIVLLGPQGAAADHLDALTNIARLMSDDLFRYEAGEARGQQDLLDALERFRVRTSLPEEAAVEAVSAGLQYTGRPFGGLAEDVRRKLPYYTGDFRDGLHPKCLASTLFLLFACLAPAVTFGGILAVLTDGQIGAVEMIAASALCGIVFALLAGQPLTILGGTGPLLVFTVILFNLCGQLKIPFLPAYLWVGIWTAVFVILMAASDSSVLMRYFTRFTDEIFAALISIIFIYEAVNALIGIFVAVYRKQTISHDGAFLSLILALGTLFIALNLSRFRRSRYLLPGMREFLADFGPMIALAVMTLVAVWFRGEVRLDVLQAPEHFGPTQSGRSWTVNPFHPDLPRWVRAAAAIPALLAAVLIYLDQNITARLINSPDHRLQKGGAYHLDLAVVGVLIAVCSVFGLPWLVAATVRSLNHVRSLATVDEVVLPSGDVRERVVHVRENRLTGLGIHLAIGASLLLLPVLKLIPMAVLYGIFLYMGIVSMKGNQFFERLSLWAMDSKLYPLTHYIRRVPLSTIHKFTLLQLGCLVVLFIVKDSPLGILFPLFIALLVPVRLLAGRWFAAGHLEILDAEEEPREEEEGWA